MRSYFTGSRKGEVCEDFAAGDRPEPRPPPQAQLTAELAGPNPSPAHPISPPQAQLTDAVMPTALHVPHGGPALLLLHFWVVVQDFVPEPGQVIHPQFVPFP